MSVSLIHWLSPVSGDFTNGADWSGGVVPSGHSDVAVLDAAGANYTVTSSAATVLSGFTIGANATLYFTAPPNTPLFFSSGTLDVAGVLKIKSPFTEGVGFSATNASGSELVAPGGTIVVGKNGALLANNLVQIAGGGTLECRGGYISLWGNAFSFEQKKLEGGKIRIDGGEVDVAAIDRNVFARFFGDDGGRFGVSANVVGDRKIATISGFSTAGATEIDVRYREGDKLETLISTAKYTSVGLLSSTGALEGYVRFSGDYTAATFETAGRGEYLVITAEILSTTNVYWLGDRGGAFSAAADWSGGEIPSGSSTDGNGVGQIAVLNTKTSKYTVTASASQSLAAFEVNAGATLFLTNAGAATTFSGAADVGGEIKVGSAAGVSRVTYNMDSRPYGITRAGGLMLVNQNGDLEVDRFSGSTSIGGVLEVVGGIFSAGDVAIGGGGKIRIDGGSVTVGVDSKVAVTFFGDGGGTFIVGAATGDDPKIADIAGFSASGATSVQVKHFAGDTLEVLASDTNHTDVGLLHNGALAGFIHFSGDYTGATFQATDSGSRLVITASPSSAPAVASLAQAMANFGAAASPALSAAAVQSTPAIQPLIAAAR